MKSTACRQHNQVTPTTTETAMPLKLMYITNRPDVAAIAERNGVDRIFVDMEYIGKAERQGKMDTVQNHHTVEDVKRVRAAITDAELLVRVNPIHDATDEYCSSEDEINAVIEAGADIIMLPYFKTIQEIHDFLSIVNGRGPCFFSRPKRLRQLLTSSLQ